MINRKKIKFFTKTSSFSNFSLSVLFIFTFLLIVFNKTDYLVINKPAKLVMHPGAGCRNGTLANALAFHYPELTQLPRCGIVHRLDKDTTGLLIVAKTEKFRNYLEIEQIGLNI